MKKVLPGLLAVAITFVFSSSIAVADCPDQVGNCVEVPNCPKATCGPQKRGSMEYGTCFSFPWCKPCHSQDYYRSRCQQKYPGKTLGCNCDNWYFSFQDDNGEEIHN